MSHTTKKRRESFARPGTGQAVPGALSQRSARPDAPSAGQSVMPSLPSRFQTLPTGKTGTLVDVKVDSPQLPAPELDVREKFSQAFQSKMPNVPTSNLQEIPTVAGIPSGAPVGAGAPSNNAITAGKQQHESVMGNLKAQLADNPVSRFLNLSPDRQQAIMLALPVVGKMGMVIGKSVKVAGSVSAAIKTKTWLDKLAVALKKTTPIAATLFAALGSYPFAGFIREEAVQTTDFAFKTAAGMNDVEKMAAATVLIDDLTDRTVQEQILGSVPIVNTVAALKEYFKAVEFKNSVNKAYLSHVSKQLENGESEDEKWARINAEKDARSLSIANERNARFEASNARIQQLTLERSRLQNEEFTASRIEGELAVQGIKTLGETERIGLRERSQRKMAKERLRQIEVESAFWLEYKKQALELETRQMENEAAFWLEYRKRVLELQEDNGRSRLGFGLLR